jgi:hypothetical protein
MPFPALNVRILGCSYLRFKASSILSVILHRVL